MSGDSTAVFFDISSPVAGMWRSWLMIDPDGRVPEYNIDNNTAGPYSVTWTSPGGIVPDRSGLRAVSPNPFGDETEIIYDLDRRTAAELAIYDLTGRGLMTGKVRHYLAGNDWRWPAVIIRSLFSEIQGRWPGRAEREDRQDQIARRREVIISPFFPYTG